MAKKPELADRLAAHLPHVDPEDQQLTPTQAVVTNLRAPQFQSTLKVGIHQNAPLQFVVSVYFEGLVILIRFRIFPRPSNPAKWVQRFLNSGSARRL